MADRALLDALDLCGLRGPSWSAWTAAAKAFAGLPMTRDERATYEQCTGRATAPREPVREALFLVGRRGGKSRFASAVGVAAACRPYPALAPGEVAVVGIAGSDRAQGAVVHGYVTAPFKQSSALRPLVRDRTRWEALRGLVSRDTRFGLELTTGVSIEVSTANFRRIRGRTFAAAICDELAFWQDEATGANPASEVLGAIRPALATLGGPLVLITTPFAKSGAVYELFTKYYGVDGAPVLVWKAPSRTMNPLLDQRVVDEAVARDEAAARAEYMAEFRDDLASFVTVEALRRCVAAGVSERAPAPDECAHFAFCDPSGGSGADSMTLAVAHGEEVEGTERVIAVLDRVVERRPPFSPEAVTAEFAEVVRSYGASEVSGDAFAPGFVAEAFARRDVSYRVSKRTRSEIYVEALAAINSQRVELLDDPKLLAQLQGLQRRAGAGGRDTVDHRAGGHDDVANAACGALALVLDAARTSRAPVVGFLGGR